MAGVKHSKRPNREPGSVNGHLPGSRAAAVADSAGGETATAAPVKKSAKAARSPAVRPAVRRRLTRKTLVRQIGEAADRCQGRPLAQRIKRLGRILGGKPCDDRRLRQAGVLLAECLDAALQAGVEADRWAACEAVTWGVAWLVRGHQADAAAGGLLERLVQVARPAIGGQQGDPRAAAPFAITLAGLFDDVEGCRPLGPAVRTWLEQDIEGHVGEAGGIRGATSGSMLTCLCHWLRCREAIAAMRGTPLSKACTDRLDRAVACGIRLLGRSGRPPEAVAPLAPATVEPLLRAASRGRRRVAATAAALTEGRDLSGAGRWNEKGLLAESFHDPQATVAVLRSGWTRDAVRVLVSYQEEVPQLEIAVGGRLVVAGPWEPVVQRGGRSLSLCSGWRPTRWEAEDDAVYFEMVADLADGFRLERAVLVLCEDNIVMLGDAVVLPTAGFGDSPPELAKPLRFCSTLSLPPTVAIETCPETTEVFGCDLKPRFLALPLGLSEWRQDGSSRGSLKVTGQQLSLEQTSPVSRLYAPLWLDLDARRLKRLRQRPDEWQRTWRPLTVADTRERLTSDQAVGYRVQEGLDQWLVYRTLDEARNRTLLGCNLSCEFFAGRFGTDGEAVRSMEVFDECELS